MAAGPVTAIARAVVASVIQTQRLRRRKKQHQASRDDRREAEDAEEEAAVAERIHSGRRVCLRALRVEQPDIGRRTGRQHCRHVTRQNHADLDETFHVSGPIGLGEAERVQATHRAIP